MIPKKPFKKGFGASVAPYYKVIAGSSYQGPGDLFSGATAWVSCARAYSAAFAAGGTAIMDLQDQVGANAITINILTTGFVDISAITTWVAAHSVSTIRVSKLYDQTNTGNHFSTGTNSQMPALTLSSLGGLPTMLGSTGAATRLTGATVSQAQPYTFSAVAIRTGVTGSATAAIGSSTVAISLGWNTANLARMAAGAGLDLAATDSSWHSMQGMGNGAANSAVNVDGSDLTGNSGATSFSGSLRLFVNSSGTFLNGSIVEAGFWPIASNATQRGDVSTNQHSAANGYNF